MRDHPSTHCPMDTLLRLLSGPWTTYVLWVLRQEGPQRFGVLKRAVPGISSRLLTERLRLLERAGVVYRDHQPTIPPQVTYRLSPRGEQLAPVLDALDELARKWSLENEREQTGKLERVASEIILEPV